MAVPKKRKSKAKARSRKANWKRKAFHSSIKALSLAKSSFSMKSNSYIYILDNLNTDSKLEA
uniref:ribosomal protein L32 n=1 Tax=Synarthrophyton patena TaxID=48972 RepID=UPI002182159D|nr:ribosomal protein L32 [Synarthrophyton patena]UVF62827.1 ribosomal protein L32 [Synarthrophyton patena]